MGGEAVPIVESLRVKGWRSYDAAEVALGPGLTVVHGANGAGKTNLLEALYFGLTGRSCRTGNEREVVAFEASAARVEVGTRDRDGAHELSVGFQPGEAKRFRVDGAPVERLADTPARPLVSVFLPDRLELVKGPPALRRSHLDQVVAALWPARVATRRAYSQALAQRNALLSRVRRGIASRESLDAWNAEVARHGIALRADRSAAVASIVEPFAAVAAELSLSGVARLEERPKVRAAGADELAEELAARVDADLERGFTGHGPHRDDLVLLLDDVMSELDAGRRELLVARVTGSPRGGGTPDAESAGPGQAVVTTTDVAHVPGATAADVTRIAVRDGAVLQEGAAAA